MEEIARFLHAHPPFNLIKFEQVEQLASVIQIEYFVAGQDILVRGGKPNEYLYVIRRGSVDMIHEDEDGSQIFDGLGEGEIFGHLSLIGGKSPIATVRAREETLAYLLPAKHFHQLRRDNPFFARFFAASAIERLGNTLQRRRDQATPELFKLRMRDLIQRELITIGPDATVHEAAQVMREHNVASLIVTTEPPGIITDRALRNRVIAEGRRYDTRVGDVMTIREPMPAESLVFEGLMKMLERGIHHMPLVESGRVIGVVTKTDVLRQQSRSPLLLPRQLERARNIDELRAYNNQVALTAGALIDSGARVRDIGRVIAVAHDALVRRLLRNAEADLGPPPCPYAWLVLGSEGRYEQTFRTDQDNALVYADDAPPDADAYFAALAERVVQNLVACGFPRCPGDIIATNPRSRQPVRVWKEYFTTWINQPDEMSLLRVTIFFDFRQVHGTLDAHAELWPVIEQAQGNRVFLGRLARAALRQPAPIGFWRNFIVERGGKERDLFDLKHRGAALVVDLARLFALEAGCDSTNTLMRLMQSVEKSSLSKTGAEELVAAFELITLLRLRHQNRQLRRNEEPTNQVSLSQLSAMWRRDLKEALLAVGRVQRHVEMAFQTDLFA
jgi:CBS domain-containing protein